MLNDVMKSLVVALIVSAISSAAKWLWKRYKASLKESQQKPMDRPVHTKPSIKKQFYVWLVTLVVSTAVFFTVVSAGSANEFPFLTAFSLIGIFFSFIFTWGAFDAMAALAPDDKARNNIAKQITQNPANQRTDNNVDTK